MATDDESRADLLARLDEIGRVAAWADEAIDAALLAGIPVLEVARRTGRNRSALNGRRNRLQAERGDA